MNKTISMFMISSLDDSKVLSAVGREYLLVYRSTGEILGSAPLENNCSFEKLDMDGHEIQYYSSFERAESALLQYRSHAKNPILESMKIVKLVFNVESSDEAIYYESNDSVPSCG